MTTYTIINYEEKYRKAIEELEKAEAEVKKLQEQSKWFWSPCKGHELERITKL